MGPPALGAHVVAGGVEFTLYATRTARAAIRLFEGGEAVRDVPLEARGGGVFGALVAGLGAGADYKFVLDDRELPDPYARALPFGVHGPARVVAPTRGSRALVDARAKVHLGTYELHVGTFTPEGTFAAAIAKLDHVASLGVGAIELMPLSSFPGRRGWGYDGVGHFAPYREYGDRADLHRFVAEAHRRGLAVLLDVVYNHFGPDGNYLGAYSPDYFGDTHTPWGHGPNFSNPFMRRFVLDNARMWFDELGFDGLRVDATHAMHDGAKPHILRELAELAAARDPPRVVIAEDERNEPALILEERMDLVWADDFHHQVRVLLTSERDGYFSAFDASVRDLARIAERGWLYDGQASPWTGVARGGDPTLVEPSAMVYCVQNHDQVGNRALGTRLSHDVDDDALLAATVLMLFLPAAPLLFMGQEWAASTPFAFFSDHAGDLGAAVTRGRREEFRRFAAFSDPERAAAIPDPQAEATFLASKLDWSELGAARHARALEIHRAMLRLRRDDRVISDGTRRGLVAAARGEALAVVRGAGSESRLCVVNFGAAEVSAFAPKGHEGEWERLVATHDGEDIPPRGAAVYRGR